VYDFSVNYRQLKPEVISLSKNYIFKGKKFEEQTTLTIEKVQTADVKEIASRDYFSE
jgi:hypothetical protein